ncbi:hypothetical protein FHS51_000938 [Sphingobium wenxiniae]|nr:MULTISPECIES: DUF2793 domain-containing protein [Sphingobium]KMS62470.1 hypothetical protein V475_07000 [Sphingobium baderi LL03]MBB6190721.1 hypothetical protein [Sphingobium wenxiniae]TWH94499.1 uncharacterized protein DUF2793 [Sphingobium wenxiniae]WRD76769.1 DUF2793 domain-containing protein [Sphingobium baderi]
MTMDMTPRWGLPLLFAGQAQKELFHNEALTRIDMLLHGQARSADLAEPPADPAIGECWIVGGGASGEWAGQEGAVACWTEGGWRFAQALAGLALWVADRGHAMRHDGTAWRSGACRADGLYVNDVRIVGERLGAVGNPSGGSTVDSQARAAIDAILDILRTHGLIAA